MRKLICFILVSVMLLCLVSCGKDSNETDTKTSLPDVTSKPTDISGDNTDVTPVPSDDGQWPASLIANLTGGSVEIPAFTGNCSGFETDASDNSVIITCIDADSTDIKNWSNGLESVGFKKTSNMTYDISDTVYIKVSYAVDMITISKVDEAGKWPYHQILSDLGFGPNDVYGVSSYNFTYDKASHTVKCENADSDLLDKVLGAFSGSGNWDYADDDYSFNLYKRDDSYPDLFAEVALNGSTLTVVFTV